ncbi:methylaspartate mutase [Fusobacterium necrophorum subsp. funduliforme]|uniref:Methylaspartate mutase subunit S n=3 Tax=Fusobacterium necrophorum TaxID=859 RepID=A0A4Q2L2F3_9FUSO|nr:methylaspartate mutase subunit S [Fusobacterium necrophorum]EHO18493.1 methylaspartate mutase, S subunit [Fusobacterium necrophorum subsp. funduliforme 1_1_36S]AVQ21971.1 methylaspartate mutase subunit S [Fusobacterium necrophorum subsp. funduliforme]AYV95585.1 methylaspartate mutase subunit S [Fusobacterium necrophorum subsp. funduliforme]EJU15221.1 putative methylaspartate mutase, S subunit [Fusobacterium necrophorum subsp. funduliforme Fnf 1007]KDE63118.1 methylaspartate mutase [Fusobact
MQSQQYKILIGVIGEDIHETGNKIIAQILEHDGFEVINLGIQASPSSFVKYSKQENVTAIIVSSLYGRGKEDCKHLMKLFQEDSLFHPPIYLGGYLASPDENWKEVEDFYLKLGFTRVYKPGTPIEKTIADLREDLMIPCEVF